MEKKLDREFGRFDVDLLDSTEYLSMPVAIRNHAYLYLLALTGWSRKHRTDGLVTRKVARQFAERMGCELKQLVRALLNVSLISVQNGDVFLTKYDKWQETKVEIEARRQAARERKERWRDGLEAAGITEGEFWKLRAQVFERDHYTCQYCGAIPRKDQLIADHVMPTRLGGATTEANLVGACRSCNTKKGSRTLEQAGMTFWNAERTPNERRTPTTEKEREKERESLNASPNPLRGTGAVKDDPAIELGVAMHELLGRQISTVDLIACQAAVNQYAYLTVKELVIRAHDHVDYCRDHTLPAPRTVDGFSDSWRRENDYRSDKGLPKAARVSGVRNTGMTKAFEMAS